jgi:hypothetical protein
MQNEGRFREEPPFFHVAEARELAQGLQRLQ